MKWRKQTEDSFSYESWAYELEFNNRSFLRQIVIGKRSLTTETSKRLALRLNLQGAELQYFDLLVQYSRARSAEKKIALGRELMSFLKIEYQQQDVKDYHDFISCTLHPQLQTLLSFRDVSKTPERLAYLLGQTTDRVEKALEVLERIRLAELGAEREWTALVKSFKVPETIGDLSLLNYHAESLREAIDAQKLPPEQRRYLSLLLPLSSEEFISFWGEFNKFKKEMIRKFSTDELRERRLFQMNLNIYSVSETMLD